MNADRWKRIQEVFEAALEVPASDRDAWIEKTCLSDSELRAEVSSLLAADQDGRTGNRTTAQDSIKLADPGGDGGCAIGGNR